MMYRLPPSPGEWIDRSRELRFEFEGAEYRGFEGDTISAALAASGVMLLGRSFKYHRSRGIFSFANHDANNLFEVDGVPNVRGDVTPVAAGAKVFAVNTRGGVARDRTRFIEWLAPFLPVGFYYKAFHGKGFPGWERRIRAISGLGRVRGNEPKLRTPKRYAFCDVLVVGGGASGLSAALSAADAGAKVLLVDENARLGGAATAELGEAIARVRGNPRIEVLTSTWAAGCYADHWVALFEPTRLTKVRAGAVIFATGVMEQPAVFRNNDLPGVMLGSAAHRLLHRHAIAPGKRVAILTANREGYELARELRDRSVNLVAALDLRAGRSGEGQELGDLRLISGVVPVAAHARGGVLSGFEFRVTDGENSTGTVETLECDALLLSVGFAPANQLASQAGVGWQFDAALQQHVPSSLPPGVFVVGRANGHYEPGAKRQDGRDAGVEAAAHASGAHEGGRPPRAGATRQVSHPFPVFPHPSGKDFVDLDEDIQVKDLIHSVQEGFDSTELLKRFSTLGMGPSQGKHSNVNGARVLMRTRGATLADTALTTQRPFYHPVPLKHLAGRGFHVHRESALHSRHADAKWMTVGGWQRPEYYRRGGESRAECIAGEVRAVREGVGLIDVSTLGKIEVFGPEAGAFLDRVYAGSFSDLRAGRTRYGLLLGEDGIVRDDGVIARLAEQHYYFTTTTSGAAAVYRELLLWNTRWRKDCAFVNGTGHRAAFNLAGPASRELLQGLIDIDVSEAAFPFLGVREGRVAGVSARVLRAGFVSALGFEIHVPYSQAGRVWDALMAAGAARGIRAFGVEAQRVLRLEKGHAIVGQDTDALTNPYEAGLDWAVKRDKEFFIGQRSLRIHEQRGLRQKLVGFLLDREAALQEANLLIDGGQIAGRITSLARSPTLGRTIGFALVSPALSAIGTALSFRASDGSMVAARVVKTPFVEAA